MENKPIASPKDIRLRVESIKNDIHIPHPSKKFPNGEIIIKAEVIKITNMIGILGGFRVSEIVTKFTSKEANLSHTLSLEVVEHYDTGEEALIFRGKTLKKIVETERVFAVPMNPKHEPWAKLVWEAWQKTGGNPCNISRQNMWKGNKIVYSGWFYMIDQQIKYKRDKETNEVIYGSNGKPEFISIDSHPKRGGTHINRHIREKELEDLQLTDPEITSYFRWSPVTLGLNPQRHRYRFIRWEEYFIKLLRKRF